METKSGRICIRSHECRVSAQLNGGEFEHLISFTNGTLKKRRVSLCGKGLCHTPKVAYFDMNSGLLQIFWCWICRDFRRPSKSQFCVQIYYCNWEPDAKVCCRWFLDHILPSVWASLRSPSSSFHLLTDLALDNPPPEVLGAWEWIRFGARACDPDRCACIDMPSSLTTCKTIRKEGRTSSLISWTSIQSIQHINIK